MRLFCVEKKKKRGKKIVAFIIISVIFAGGFAAFFLIKGTPKAEKIIGAQVRNAASTQIDNAVLRYMEENSLTYGSLVNINFDEKGAINSVTADAAKIDAIIVRMDTDIGDMLKEQVMTVSVPLSVIFGTNLLVPWKKCIDVKYFPINVVNVNLRHEFEAKGINQTLHTIYLNIAVDVEVLLPLRNTTESISTEILLGQTLIVGSVPNTYVQRR